MDSAPTAAVRSLPAPPDTAQHLAHTLASALDRTNRLAAMVFDQYRREEAPSRITVEEASDLRAELALAQAVLAAVRAGAAS